MHQKGSSLARESKLRHGKGMDFLGQSDMAAVLVIDSNDSRRDDTVFFLNDQGIDTYDVPDTLDAIHVLGRGTFKLFIIRASKRLLAVQSFLKRARKHHPNIQVLLSLPEGSDTGPFDLGAGDSVVSPDISDETLSALAKDCLGIVAADHFEPFDLEHEPPTIEITPALTPTPSTQKSADSFLNDTQKISTLEEKRSPASTQKMHALDYQEKTEKNFITRVPEPFDFSEAAKETMLGELDPQTNAAILMGLAAQNANGHLVARHGEDTISLYLRNGRVFSGMSERSTTAVIAIFFVASGGDIWFKESVVDGEQEAMSVFELVLGSVIGNGATLAEVRIDPLPALSAAAPILEHFFKKLDIVDLIGQGIPAYNLATALQSVSEHRGNEVIAALLKARLCLAVSDDREPTQRIQLTAPTSTLSDIAPESNIDGLEALLLDAKSSHDVLGVLESVDLDQLRLAYEARVAMLGTACVDPAISTEQRQRAVGLRMQLKRAYDACRKMRLDA